MSQGTNGHETPCLQGFSCLWVLHHKKWEPYKQKIGSLFFSFYKAVCVSRAINPAAIFQKTRIQVLCGSYTVRTSRSGSETVTAKNGMLHQWQITARDLWMKFHRISVRICILICIIILSGQIQRLLM